MALLSEPPTVEQSPHLVQFYRDDAELYAGAGGFLLEGLQAGEVVIVIATDEHCAGFAAHARERGFDILAARDQGRLIELDAPTLLTTLAPGGVLDHQVFLEVIGTTVRAAVATGRPVRAYGELVALLWEVGHVMTAVELEEAWNDLGAEMPFSLYCAYPSEAVGGNDDSVPLQQVCKLHSAVVPSRPAEETWHFECDPSAPAEARRLVTEVLRRAGHDGPLLEDARVVVTELAANAVTHARSRFSITLRHGPSSVRIAARDGSRVRPEVGRQDLDSPSGRGLRLVTALARQWGVDLEADGKLVWAELVP